MAAPHVTGTAALYLQQHPLATPQEVKDAIVGSASLSSGNTPVLNIGDGLLGSNDAAQQQVPQGPISEGVFILPPPSNDSNNGEAEYTCEVTQWTSWTSCTGTIPCSTGFRSRFRFVSNEIPKC